MSLSDDRFKLRDEGIVLVVGIPGGAALPMVPTTPAAQASGTGTLRMTLDLYRGDTREWMFTFYDDAAKTVPSDLSNATARAEVRYGTGGAAILTLECEVQPGPPDNVVLMTLPATAWDGFPVLYGVNAQWDLQLTYADGRVVTVVAGPVYITADITDSTPVVVTPVMP